MDIDDPEIMPKFLRQNFVFAGNLHQRPGIFMSGSLIIMENSCFEVPYKIPVLKVN